MTNGRAGSPRPLGRPGAIVLAVEHQQRYRAFRDALPRRVHSFPALPFMKWFFAGLIALGGYMCVRSLKLL
jgi:hypothetical protein